MGREIRRVPLDFDWPLQKVWEGFKNPFYTATECPTCSGECYNPETQKLAVSFYDTENYEVTWYYRRENGHAVEVIATDDCERWCDKILQEELDTLIALGIVNPDTTLDRVRKDFSGASRGELIECRARRLGVYGVCPSCNGTGIEWETKAHKILSDRWEEIPPPTGEGWQVWETVSLGSPITPVFATPEELIEELATNGTAWRKDAYSKESATAFVKSESGWVPSMMCVGGEAYNDINCASALEDSTKE
jgi:hypothetical protein